jgi:hypothetical protein
MTDVAVCHAFSFPSRFITVFCFVYVYRVLVGKPEGKRPLERSRRRWEDVIKMDLREIGWGGVWSGFTWLRIGIVGGLL